MDNNTKDILALTIIIAVVLITIAIIFTGLAIVGKRKVYQDNPFMDCKRLESSVWRCENDKYTCFEFTYKEGNATQCLNK
jgi:hypothetical protein